MKILRILKSIHPLCKVDFSPESEVGISVCARSRRKFKCDEVGNDVLTTTAWEILLKLRLIHNVVVVGIRINNPKIKKLVKKY